MAHMVVLEVDLYIFPIGYLIFFQVSNSTYTLMKFKGESITICYLSLIVGLPTLNGIEKMKDLKTKHLYLQLCLNQFANSCI